jgi:hypothetical protein
LLKGIKKNSQENNLKRLGPSPIRIIKDARRSIFYGFNEKGWEKKCGFQEN